jgi:uncharacterized membrane protein
MNTKLFILSVILFISVFAFAMESDIKNIDAVLLEIRTEQGLKDKGKINPDKVKPKLLEELGDSVMELTIGNHDRHEIMDKMMGGDGSASLTTMHQNIGYSYLSGNYNGIGMMNGYSNSKFGLKGGAMMWNNGNWMMGTGASWIFGLLFFIVLLLLIAVIIYLVLRNNKKTNFESPQEILKKRYAKGDISKEDFDKMKKELEN